jgi:hypothetical protein
MVSTWKHGRLGVPQKLLEKIKCEPVYLTPYKDQHTLVLIGWQMIWAS